VISLKALTVVSVTAILVAGCISYDQELVLNDDGSGTVKIHYTSDDPHGAEGAPVLPFTEKKIEADFAGSGAVVRDVYVFAPNEPAEGSHEAVYYLDFTDITDLNGRGIFAVKDPTGTRDAMTQIFTLEEAGGTTTFTQTCTLNIEVEDTTGLEDYRFTYSLTCPEAVTMANGTVESGGYTVNWSYTLPELINNPVKMYAVYRESGGTGQGCIGTGMVSD
jgi:hypothetical protein